MPSIFKALASITVWILFVFGCLSLLGGFSRMFGIGAGGTVLISAYMGLGITSLILSVVAAILRQMIK